MTHLSFVCKAIHTSHHPLAYSEAAKYDGRRKTTVGDTWRYDERRRTPEIVNQRVAAFLASGKPRSQLHLFASAEDTCVDLPPRVMQMEILELSPPDLLHVGKLGPPNDVMDHCFIVDRPFMEQFYYDCDIDERATMYGNKLLGKDVDKVWEEENLVKLLPFPNGDKIVAFLRAVRELYSVAVRKILPPEDVRKEAIDSYRATLRVMVEARIITETPKARILSYEVPRYWQITGMSLYYALTEQHEATHAMLKQSEVAHGTKVQMNTGTPKHIETLTRSVVYYSSKSFNLLPKSDEGEIEDEGQLTVESVPEQEAPVQQEPSDPAPLAVYTPEDVANLQRQLAEAREELSAKDEIIKVKCSKKCIEILFI